MEHRCRSAAVIIGGVLLTAAPHAYAVGSSGFENATLSTRTLARANAVVADPEEPSTIAFNPAGLSKLEGFQFYFGTNMIAVSTHYEGAKGRSEEDSSETILPTPFAYISMPTPIEKLRFGFGANSPFGLASNWSSTGHFQFIAHYNELTTAAYHFSLGYEISPSLAIGGGWTHMETGIKQTGKFNTAFLSGVAGVAPSPFELDLEGDGQGWNLGLLWTPEERHSVGVFFRSQLHAEYSGTLSSDTLGVLAGAFGGGGNVTTADTDYSFPANITVGYNFAPNKKFDIEVDLGWTDWSSYDSVRVAFGGSNAVLRGFELTNRDFEDTLSVHTGMSYKTTDVWTFLGGYYFQQMAANENNYSNEIPDGDRHGMTFGLEFNQGSWTLDVMYLFAFTTKQTIENVTGGANGTDIDGAFSGHIQVLTTGLRYRF